jgi:hypothetical protein
VCVSVYFMLWISKYDKRFHSHNGQVSLCVSVFDTNSIFMNNSFFTIHTNDIACYKLKYDVYINLLIHPLIRLATIELRFRTDKWKTMDEVKEKIHSALRIIVNLHKTFFLLYFAPISLEYVDFVYFSSHSLTHTVCRLFIAPQNKRERKISVFTDLELHFHFYFAILCFNFFEWKFFAFSSFCFFPPNILTRLPFLILLFSVAYTWRSLYLMISILFHSQTFTYSYQNSIPVSTKFLLKSFSGISRQIFFWIFCEARVSLSTNQLISVK